MRKKQEINQNIEKLKKIKKSALLVSIASLIAAVLLLIFTKKLLNSVIGFFSIALVFSLYLYFQRTLKVSARIKKIEAIFPDFLQLMASNLRAGMTIDRAMLLSSRPEFAPLDEEILKAGKDITTGKIIESAMLDMSTRINSEKIHKTILLIISGIQAGGDIAVLLEETAVNMREKDFVEKRAGSNVMMYSIFVFAAVSVGAPILFSLSSILVEILVNLMSGLPAVEAPVNLPFTLSSINVSVNFIKYFCIIFIIVIDILASLVLGLVSKGEEKEGFKYILPLLAISMSVFFAIRFFLAGFVAGLFG